jgi:hypothetical protein
LTKPWRWRPATGPATIAGGTAYIAYRTAWEAAEGAVPDRMAMDTALHRARVTRTRQQVRHEGTLEELPDGTFVMWEDRAHLVLGRQPFAIHARGLPNPRCPAPPAPSRS